MNNEIRYVSICGMLGYGYPRESLARALESDPHFLGVDAGSTDPGPYYLGSGEGFVQPLQMRRDLTPALTAAANAGIPFIIGSAGGAGARPHLDDTLAMIREIAKTEGLHFRVASIAADIPAQAVVEALGEGRIDHDGAAGELTEDEAKKGKDEIQKLTDQHEKMITQALEAKTAEIEDA